MSSQYARGRRQEENVVNLLKSSGFQARRIELSGRWRSDKADIAIYYNGLPVYASVKYGCQVPKSLYQADVVLFPKAIALTWPLSGSNIFIAKRLPLLVARELSVCQLFFGRRKRQPWKVVLGKEVFESDLARALFPGTTGKEFQAPGVDP